MGTHVCDSLLIPRVQNLQSADRSAQATCDLIEHLRRLRSAAAADAWHGAAGMGFNWERYEAWRKHPMMTNNLRLRHSLPGLGIATAAFGIFVAYDKLVAGNSGGHH